MSSPLPGLLAAGLLIGAVFGCAADSSPTSAVVTPSGSDATGQSPSPTATGTATTSSTPIPTSTSLPPHSARIGDDSVTYASGLAVSVPDVRRFTPSQTAVGMTANTVGVVVTVQVHNGSSDALDATLLTVAVAAAGKIAARIFDASQDVSSGITGSIAAGARASGKYAFAVPEDGLDPIEVRVTPDLQQPETAVFTGAVP